MKKVFIVLEEQECGYVDPGIVRVFANQNDAVDYAAQLSKDPMYKNSVLFIECFEVF